MGSSTQICNATKYTMKLQVGSAQFASNLATVQAGGTYTVAVDFNATYREYVMQVDAPGLEKVIVSSDDLCANKGITIKEEDGKLNVENDPRQSETSPVNPPSLNSEKPKWMPAWMSRSKR